MFINKLDMIRADDHKSMYLDVDTGNYLARLTIWSRGTNEGLCDAEILNVATEERVLWKHDEYHTDEQFQDIVRAFWFELGRLDDTNHFSVDLVNNNIRTSAVLEPLLTAAAQG